MFLKMYQVDAFSDRILGGNPAAVLIVEEWLPDSLMQSIAAENNLAETAFVKRAGDGWDLRWFTPTVEVDFCGHATLATAHVLVTGAIVVAVNCSVITTIMGVIFIGSVTAPLGTHFSLILDRLSPPHQKAQVFALLRTAIAAGIIIASALLTAGSLSFSLTVLTAFLSVVTAAMAAGIMRK